MDMHQDGWGAVFSNATSKTPWAGEGAPAWATCTQGFKFTAPSKWMLAYTDPAVEAAFDSFFANNVTGDLQGEFERVWRAVATHYASNKNVIGYELFNEPADATVALGAEFDRKLQCLYAGERYSPISCAVTVPATQPLADGLIPAIQSIDPNHVIFYEAPVLTDYLAPETIGVLEPLPFPRLVLSFHVYGASGLALQTFRCTDPTCGPTETADLAGFSTYRAATRTSQPGGPAWFMSEFGAEDYAPDVARVAAMADARSLSWAEWAGLQLHDPGANGTPEAVLNDTTRQPEPALATALARAYPFATSGTPGPSTFDTTTAAFAYSYTPDPRIKAPTEIVLPAWRYAHGYTATVTGAHITSAPCTTPLLLQNDPGASTVTVTLKPADRNCQTNGQPPAPAASR
jgi:endoglycosylceramidase